MIPSLKRHKKNEAIFSALFDHNFNDDSRGDGSFLYVLPCSDRLKKITRKKFMVLGSLLEFRKFGRC